MPDKRYHCPRCGLLYTYCPCVREELRGVEATMNALEAESLPKRNVRKPSRSSKSFRAITDFRQLSAGLEAEALETLGAGAMFLDDGYRRLLGLGMRVPDRAMVIAALEPLGGFCPVCRTKQKLALRTSAYGAFFFQYPSPDTGKWMEPKAACIDCAVNGALYTTSIEELTAARIKLVNWYVMQANLSSCWLSKVPRYTLSNQRRMLSREVAIRVNERGTLPCVGWWNASPDKLIRVYQTKTGDCPHVDEPGYERVVGGAHRFTFSRSGLQCVTCSTYTQRMANQSLISLAEVKTLKKRLLVEGMRYGTSLPGRTKEGTKAHRQREAVCHNSFGMCLQRPMFTETTLAAAPYCLPWYNWHTLEIEYTGQVADSILKSGL